MPLVGSGIIIDADRRAKGQSAVGAADEFHVRPIGVVGRADTGAHINVIVSGAA